MVPRKNLTYSEFKQNLDVKYFESDLQVYQTPECIYEILGSNEFLPSVITITFDDLTRKTTLGIEQNSAVLRFS